MPKGCNSGIICPVFKKGDMKKITNIQRISLLNTALQKYKVLCIQKTYLKNTRMVLKKGKSAIYHTLRQLKEKYYKYNRNLHNMLSVDLKQSYYSFNHVKL